MFDVRDDFTLSVESLNDYVQVHTYTSEKLARTRTRCHKLCDIRVQLICNYYFTCKTASIASNDNRIVLLNQ